MKELEKLILENLLEASEILEKNEKVVNFLKVNEIIDKIEFKDLSVSTFTSGNSLYNKVTIKKIGLDLRKQFRPTIGYVEYYDKNTEYGQKQIVEETKKRWKIYTKKYYPEFVNG
jgi:hypothetical protein